MRRSRTAFGTIVLLALMVAGAVSAGGAKKPRDASPHYALVGTWDVTLSLPGTPPGRVLATFNGDGSTVDTPAAPASLRGMSLGSWKRIGPYLFSVTRVFFRFNPVNGAFLGTTKVNATARVAPDRKTFSAVSVSELRDPAGTVVASDLRGTATATRVEVEEIPDRP